MIVKALETSVNGEEKKGFHHVTGRLGKLACRARPSEKASALYAAY